MFGFPRLRELMGRAASTSPVDGLLAELDRFTGPAWEQEDDITLVSIVRAAVVTAPSTAPEGQPLAAFEVASDLGNERMAAERVVDAVASLALAAPVVERLRTVVAEATMNAIEHGNGCRTEVPVRLQVSASPTALTIRVVDQGGDVALPDAETPDLGAKLEGLQTPRGWGLFLMRAMVDDLEVTSDGDERTVELTIRLDKDNDKEPV
jgi:anti-sigma regulatory factor (Ser/Thr protein kinase)